MRRGAPEFDLAAAERSAGQAASRGVGLGLGIALAAICARLVGLGGSSMWLDEILETRMARGSLSQLFRDLLYDRAQPPVEPLLSWGLLALGQGELVRRAVNVLIGAAAVVLFSRWVARRFGGATALVTGLLLAASPVLVRYSHELRPYAVSLLLTVWTLDAAQRWLDRGGAQFPGELCAAGALASMSHYLAVAIWIPVAAAWLETRSEGRTAASLGRLLQVAALSSLPLTGWFVLLAARGGPEQPFRTARWSWELVERRFEDLLLRGYVGQQLVPGASLLLAILVLLGFAILARKKGGLTVFAGLFAGTFVVEVVLVAMGRFSHLRYNQLALLFLATAMAVACVAAARSIGALNRSAGRATVALLAGAVLAAFANGLVGYAQHGRPDWPAVARAVERLEGTAARVIANNAWAQISIGYYLGRPQTPSGEPAGVATIYDDRTRLLEELAQTGGRCALVLEANVASPPAIFGGLRPRRPVLELPDTNRARLYRFAVGETARQDCFPPADFRLEPSPGYGALFPWAVRVEGSFG